MGKNLKSATTWKALDYLPVPFNYVDTQTSTSEVIYSSIIT